MNIMAKIVVDAVRENVLKVTSFVEGEAERLSCPFNCMAKINVAIDELFCNIASYAYPNSKGQASIQVESDEPNSIRITFEDYGIPYDPLKKPDPDVTLSAEERQIGGLGIYIVKKTMDSMNYEYKNGKNVLTIVKKW